jgi:hypothetical protein
MRVCIIIFLGSEIGCVFSSQINNINDIFLTIFFRATNNVLQTSLLLESLPHSSTVALDVYKSYVRVLPKLWDSCYQLNWRLFRAAMEALFVRKFFTNRLYDARMTAEVSRLKFEYPLTFGSPVGSVPHAICSIENVTSDEFLFPRESPVSPYRVTSLGAGGVPFA